MKSLRIFSLTLVGAALLASCGQQKSDVASIPSVETYENEFFSLQYPSSWTYDEEYNDINDTIPLMQQGVTATFYSAFLPSSQSIRIVRSAMFNIDDLSAEDWRDFSIENKQYDSQYVGWVEALTADSLTFAGHPAASTGFAVVPESTADTLIQKQIIVKADSIIYYLNSVFDARDDGRLQAFGDSILATLKIK